MLTVENQNIEDSYQALITQCSRNQCEGTCSNECLICDLSKAMKNSVEEVNNNVRE